MDSILTLRLLTQILSYSYDIVTMVLALWRLCNLVANEKGPFYIFHKIRVIVRAWCVFGPEHGVKFFCKLHAYELIQCEYCNSLWIAPMLLWLYHVWGHAFVLYGLTWLALSTTTIFLKVTHEKLKR